MTTVLALDTATAVSSVAVVTETRVRAEISVEARLAHAETLVPHIEEALRLADVRRDALTAVAVSLGPGSFTGLRIGLAAAKGLAYALGIPLIGVPTLEALAAAFPVSGALVAPMIDAQRGCVYFALYAWTSEGLSVRREAEVMPLAALSEALAAEKSAVWLTGDGVRGAAARGILPKNAIVPPVTHRMPRASLTAARALERLAHGEGGDAMTMEPIYIRRAAAEERAGRADG